MWPKPLHQSSLRQFRTTVFNILSFLWLYWVHRIHVRQALLYVKCHQHLSDHTHGLAMGSCSSTPSKPHHRKAATKPASPPAVSSLAEAPRPPPPTDYEEWEWDSESREWRTPRPWWWNPEAYWDTEDKEWRKKRPEGENWYWDNTYNAWFRGPPKFLSP